jgi:hypothetical protein
VQKWGDALVCQFCDWAEAPIWIKLTYGFQLHKTPGVSLESPPSDLVFRTITKRPEAAAPAPAPCAPPIETNENSTNARLSPDAPGTHTIGDYLVFIDCDAAEVQDISVILRNNGFKLYGLFGLPHVDNLSLLKLGLTLGLILWLRDNVVDFHMHLKQRNQCVM